MIIKRKKYHPEEIQTQLTNTLHDTVNTAEGFVDGIDQSSIGQIAPVRKKTRMARNVMSGIKGLLSSKKKKQKSSVDNGKLLRDKNEVGEQ